jgi:osmotically-inducible protein OsmY
MSRRTVTQFVAAALIAVGLAACSTSGPTASNSENWLDDSWITTKVKTDLATAPGVPSTAISVETTRGVVQLSGFASSHHRVAMATHTYTSFNTHS